jgi:hypothetical protein
MINPTLITYKTTAKDTAHNWFANIAVIKNRALAKELIIANTVRWISSFLLTTG